MKKGTALCIVLLFVLTAVAPSASSVQSDEDTADLHLLRVEHYLYVDVIADAQQTEVQYVFPPKYGHQVPVFLEVFEDSTQDIIWYDIISDDDDTNLLAVFRLNDVVAGERLLIHFECWVLVHGSDFEDMPESVGFPEESELPTDTVEFLRASPVVQLEKSVLGIHAKHLRSGSGDDVITFADEVASFIYGHHRMMFLFSYVFGIFFAQDAVTTLLLNGENVGRSHLASALFRSNGIPSRSLLALPDQGFWTQMHYMNEYYVPGYGWVMIDGTACSTPYPSYRQVILRVCDIDDEEDTKNDYLFSRMSGEERWFWYDEQVIAPYYLDCDVGSSRSQMFSEAMLPSGDADVVLTLTSEVFGLYRQYLGEELSSDQGLVFDRAVEFQKEAVWSFAVNECLEGYVLLLESARDEYSDIVS